MTPTCSIPQAILLAKGISADAFATWNEKLPLHLLQRCAGRGAPAGLVDCARDILSASDSSLQQSPEVYLLLDVLARGSAEEWFYDWASAFRFHMLADIAPPRPTRPGAVLRSPRQGLAFLGDDAWPTNAFTSAGVHDLMIGLPRSGLYRDFIPSSMYERDVEDSDARHSAVAVMRALERISEFSRPIFEDVCSAVSLINITPQSSPKSFSGRLGYLGGIFLNTRVEEGRRIEEAILHEYVHQRFWLWWAFDHPVHPDRRLQSMISPVSGNRRTIETMLQAYYVYGQVAAYYRWRLTKGADEDSWVANRLSKISSGLELLEKELLTQEVLSAGITLAEIDPLRRHSKARDLRIPDAVRR